MKILVLGGRGHLGKVVVSKLKGKVYTFDRHPGKKNHIQGDITNTTDVTDAAKGKDILINLIGLSPIWQPRKTTYEKVHVLGIKNILAACAHHKTRLIHISALGADSSSDIDFLRTKGRAEELVQASGINHTIFRPSVVFDEENELIALAARFSWTRAFPHITAKLQPIYREDVAELIALAVKKKIHGIQEIAGEKIFTTYEIAREVYNKKGKKCLPIPEFLAPISLYFLALLLNKRISHNQIKNMRIHNTTSKNAAQRYIELTSFTEWLRDTDEI